MNTKFSFALLMIVIAIIATACAPDIVNGSASIINAVQPEDDILAPLNGEAASTAAREAQELQLWSGEIFFSDTGNPDHLQNAVPAATDAPQTECMSEDSLPKRQSGCVE